MGNCYSESSYYENSFFKKTYNFPAGASKSMSKNLLIFGQNKKGVAFISHFNHKKKILQKIASPKNATFYNYSGITQKSENVIVICGGIKHNLVGITNECFEYDLESNRITKLPSMLQVRYTFPVIYHNSKIYAIGGRVYGDDNQSILQKCEVFDYAVNGWKMIADMNITRCTASAFIYGNSIWVFGGYTGLYQRSRKIEKYIEWKNKWEVIEFKLYHGFENGNIFSTENPNEIIIFGGKYNYGPSMTVMLYNLKHGTVLNMKPLMSNHVLSKHFIAEDNLIYLLTEENANVVYEVYSPQQNIYERGHVTGAVLKELSKFKQYNFNTLNVSIEQDNSVIPPIDNYKDLNVVFGNDSEPFQLNIHSKTGEVTLLPVKLNLIVRHFQGCVRLSENEVFFCGGTNQTEQKLVQKSYFYNLATFTVSRKELMARPRHSFAIAHLENYIYVCGGKEAGNQNYATINYCERYNVKTGGWSNIASLNYSRFRASAFVWKNKLYVAGGILSNEFKTDTIEVYEEHKDIWYGFGVTLPGKLYGMLCIPVNDLLFIGSGNTEKWESYHKFMLDLSLGDLAKPINFSDSFKSESSDNKYALVKDRLVIFGGSKFIFYLNRETFKNCQKKLPNQKAQGSFINADENEGENMVWDQLDLSLSSAFAKVSFSKSYLKKNAFITTTF